MGVFGNTFGDTFAGQQGTLLNYLPTWAETPYFALPERGIDVIASKEVTIYGDTLVNLPIENNMSVIYTCAIGTQSGNNLIINHSVAGNYECTAVFKEGNIVFSTQTFNINVLAAAAGSVKVLMVGDSLVYLGISDVNTGLDAALTPTFTLLGSQGTTLKHEGMPGFGYTRVLTDDGSETYPNHFIKEGVLNIPAYFTDYSIDTPDYVLIRHGVNDLFGQSIGTFTEVELTSLINDSKTLIDAFLAFDANLKIIIGLPTLCENTGAGWNANYDESIYNQDKYIQYIHQFWDALIETYDNYVYNDRVCISNESIFLDRNDGYPKTDGVHTNGVHPDASGYQQLGNGIAAAINQQLSLMPSNLTLSLISGGVKIDWIDNSGGTFETEIWGKNDSDSYALLYTIAVGTVTKSETINAVDLRYYKIRGKKGTYLTQFTAEQSIAMLGTELITNGNFSSWTGDNPDNWTVNGEGVNGTITEDSGKCRMIVTGTGVSLYKAGILQNGSKYRFKINVVSIVSGECVIKYSSLKYTRFATTGSKTIYDTTDNADFAITRWSGDTDFTIDDVSIKKVLMP